MRIPSRKWRRRLFAIGLIVLLALGLTAAFEPNRVVPGLIGGDAFFQNRPTRFWRNKFREAMEAGQLSEELERAFSSRTSASGVLVQCMGDPDPHVRRVAAVLLGDAGENQVAVSTLRTALHDPDVEVRLKALHALGRRQRNAMAAGTDLAALLNDPELQIADEARIALWLVNPRYAVEACGWKPFESKHWAFSAVFPSEPKEKIGETLTPFGIFERHSWTQNEGVDHFTVAVIEYSQETVDAIPPNEWIRRLKENPGPMGLHMVSEKRNNATWETGLGNCV